MKLSQIPKLSELLDLYPETKAIAFDMDGTLLNTELLHARAHLELLKQSSPDQTEFTIQKMMHDYLGVDDPKVYAALQLKGYFQDLKSFQDFTIEKNLMMSTIVRTTDQEYFFPLKMKLLLEEIKASNLSLFLVTSSEREFCHWILKEFKIYDHFDLITTRNDVKNCKPDPEPYLMTFEKMNIPSENVIIFEDSPVGLQAGKSSKANIIQVLWYETI